MHKSAIRVDVGVAATLRAMPAEQRLGMKGTWQLTCRGKDGQVKWQDTIDNIVVNAGLNHILDVVLSAATQVTAWYIGLLSTTPTVAAGDTMSSHAGWTEVVAYDESARVAFVDAGASGQSLSNAASAAAFTISTNGTGVGGAFLTSGSAKSGTTGTLYAAGAFTAGNKDLDDGDTIDVTFTATAAAA